MAHYESDFTTGRYTRYPNTGYGSGYDSAYGAGRGRLSGSQGAGWYGWEEGRPAQRGWDDFGHPGGFRDRGESRFNRGAGGQEFGAERWRGFDRSGSTDFDRYGSAGYGPSEFRPSGYTGYGTGRYGSTGYGSEPGMGGGEMSRGYTSRDRQGFGNRPEYDQDFGDRIRHGWDRFRNEARNWVGRGYDRGW